MGVSVDSTRQNEQDWDRQARKDHNHNSLDLLVVPKRLFGLATFGHGHERVGEFGELGGQ
jgi:hypothetical protein